MPGGENSIDYPSDPDETTQIAIIVTILEKWIESDEDDGGDEEDVARSIVESLNARRWSLIEEANAADDIFFPKSIEGLQPSRRAVLEPILGAIQHQFPAARKEDCDRLAFQIAWDMLHATEGGDGTWRIYPLKNVDDYFGD
jgi:hypothetical protein